MFEWKTDEDGEWVAETAVTDSPPVNRKWGRWVAAGVVLALLVGGVGWSLRLAENQVGAATQQLEGEVVAAHQLLQTAVASQDNELVSSALAPNAVWQQEQAQLIQRHLYWNRSSLGLWLDTSRFNPGQAADTAVTFSPDLTEAILTYTLPYATEDTAGNLTRFPLQRTAVYRQINHTWQQTPYPDGFWGDTVRYDLDDFSLLAPERDEAISRRLAQDLSQIFHALCQLDGLDCPPNFRVEVTLQSEPDSLQKLNQDYRAGTRYRSRDGRIYEITLPAPTLVGLPRDDAGYQALYRGYAAQMAARLIASIDSNCCFLGLSQSSDLALYLQDLGLQPPRAPEYQPFALAVPPPIPLPEQDIVALCRDDAFAALRYQVETAVWQPEFIPQDGYVLQMAGLNGQGVIVVVSPLQNEFNVSLWWVRQGQAVPLYFDDDLPRYLLDVQPYSAETDGRYVLFFNADTAFAENGYDWALLDEATCTDTGCPLRPLDSWPRFSPDGRFSLVQQYRPDGISDWSLGDGAGNPGQPLLDVAFPVWLDAKTIAFTRAAELQPTLWIAGIEPDGRLGEATQINLKPALGADVPKSEWFIQAILPDPEQPNDLYLLLLGGPFPGAAALPSAQVIRYDLAENTAVRLPVAGNNELTGAFDIQIHGRYLTIAGLDGVRFVLYLYDLETSETTAYELAAPQAAYHWSADGQWLLIPQGTSLRLVAPAAAYERQIFHDLTACDTAVWVEQLLGK